jgi:predicted DNA-binding transcriptional regulator AlpA
MLADQTRNFALAIQVSRMRDDVLVGVTEVAALCGLSEVYVKQRRVPGFPPPHPRLRLLKWRLGDVRDWMRTTPPVRGTP